MYDPTKKRSRRLRKKLHLGEFQKFGFPLTFTFDPQQTDFDEALDNWLAFAESQAWGFYGGGAIADHIINGYLCQFDGGTLTEQDRAASEKWLAAQPWVTSHQVAPLTDAWYGPFEA
ncbi:50S ribosome-binding protein YggL [Aeromonas schubertii]|uniref:DUF469 domain-containing protein n=1 Tax=Aeromonas schubertii TaxID=652 RepID=A0A0S2SEN6_9GAMM|nr:50S ribosome-binding protein YggL [Aeromonas schubertii]ALP40167.1 hypothetical protein WL1483_748 [Aeromonas schubertii]